MSGRARRKSQKRKLFWQPLEGIVLYSSKPKKYTVYYEKLEGPVTWEFTRKEKEGEGPLE